MSEIYDSEADNRRLLAAFERWLVKDRAFLAKMAVVIAEMIKSRPVVKK